MPPPSTHGAAGGGADGAAGFGRDAGTAVAAIVCGRHHSALLTARGGVFTWGASGFGRLGHAESEKVVSSPRIVSSMRPYEVGGGDDASSSIIAD